MFSNFKSIPYKREWNKISFELSFRDNLPIRDFGNEVKLKSQYLWICKPNITIRR